MENLEYLDECMEEEILVVEHPKQKQELEAVESGDLESNFFLHAETSNTPHEKAKKARKRKLLEKQTKSEPLKTKTISTGQLLKLYAYKDCLGKYNSLIKNPDMPLWCRDGNFLFQKYLRQRCNEDGLFYYSTQIYSCWEEERVDEYLELDAEIVMKNDINFVVKILNVDEIENLCLLGNFKELGLTPYSNNLRDVSSSDKDNATAYTIKMLPNDATTDNNNNTL